MLPDFRVRQRDYLLEIARAMTSQLNLDAVLRLILQSAASMLGGEVGLIALVDDDGRFRARATIGVDAAHLHLFAPLLDNLDDKSNHDQHNYNHGGLDFEALDLKMRVVARALDIRLRQVIALPLIIREENVGVIFVFRTYRAEPNPNDTAVLQSFADQAAVAVFNARLYQSVSAEQMRLAAILDHSGDGIMILDGSGHIQRFNKALGRIVGCSPTEVIGNLHDDVIMWDHIEMGTALDAALASGWPQQTAADAPPDTIYVEGDLTRCDGTAISVGITYAPLLSGSGKLSNVIGSVRDITNFRKAQEMKSTFISVVSHELKTPVALIKGYAGTLRREDANWDKATIRNSLKVIEEEADRLTGLIENLLAASKLQAEGMRINIGDVRLDLLAARSVERFQVQTPIHQLKLDFPPNFPSVQGDQTRLRQVLDNLINNAIKYSPAGGEIRISGAFDDHSVTVAVSDPGVGISEEQLEHIFERFYRVDDALSRKTQGTGLGLYLARAVIDAHHGTIEVDSQVGKGSTFRFTIPISQP
ncbi:MAG: ATP-binding protein [Anaerolineae bacterium]